MCEKIRLIVDLTEYAGPYFTIWLIRAKFSKEISEKVEHLNNLKRRAHYACKIRKKADHLE